MAEKHPYVYLMASKRNGTIYVGVTSDLPARVWKHKNDEFEGFTKKYQVHTLVYYEEHGDLLSAFEREKQMKKWRRKRKLAWIEKHNPGWIDFSDDVLSNV